MGDAADRALDVLREELEYFKQQKSEWLKHYEGDFVLVKGSELIGHFTTFEEAYNAGVSKFGAGPFLIKQVLAEEPVVAILASWTAMIRAHF